MDQVISAFFSAETLIYCVIVYLAVLGFRRGVEWVAKKLMPVTPDNWEDNIDHAWTKTILPFMPLVFGVGLALLFPAYPFPASFAASKAGLAAFGFVCGLCSSWVFKFAKEQLEKLVKTKDAKPE